MSDEIPPARSIYVNDTVHVTWSDFLGLYHVFIVSETPRSFIHADEAQRHIRKKTGYVISLTSAVN